MFTIEDFEYKNYIGDWVTDYNIVPTLKEMAETLYAFDRNSDNFDFSEEELHDAVLDKGYTLDQVYSMFLVYFYNG